MLEIGQNKEKSTSDINGQKSLGFRFETMVYKTSQNLPLSVREIGSSDLFSEWERYVEGHPDAHIFCHPLWVKALENEYGLKASVLICQDSANKIKGLIPLMPTLGLPLKMKSPITGCRWSALPRTPLGGFLFDDANVQLLLLKYAIEKISKKDNIFLQLKSYSSGLNENIEELMKLNWRSSFYLNLPDCPSKIRFGDKKRHHKVKWAVNKAISLGINVREAESENDLKEWYRLYLETVRWHMVPARPFRFFKFLFENLFPKGLMKLLLAEYKVANRRELVAGSIFLNYGDTIFYSFNGRNKAGLLSHANDLIQWQAIHNACQRGFLFYDMGEVSEGNDTLAQFKSKWGCESKQIYHYYFSRNDQFNSNIVGTEVGSDFLRAVWRKLPLKVTREWGILTNRFL